MKYLLLILSMSILLSGEIDASNQRVTNVGSPTDMQDAVNTEFLQNALRESGPFEYKSVLLRFFDENSYNNSSPPEYRAYKDLESTNYIGSNFDDYLSSLSSQGYELYKISDPMIYTGYTMYLYTFRKSI